MPCYHPVVAYRSREGRSSSGAWPLVFTKSRGYQDMELKVPCGQCIGCRLEHSRQWAIRCCFESQMHTDNCFITVTYSDDFLPDDHSLDKREFQLFMKRLRKEIKVEIKFFMCGEYGSKYDRPHYHACLFGYNFPDRELWSIRKGVRLYRSRILERLWPKGHSTVGDVTFESAAYVARYCLKKVTGDNAPYYYEGRTPEYATMSRRPGLASGWFAKYGKSDVLPGDKIIIRNGLTCRPPRYYDNMVSLMDKHLMERIKYHRGCVVDKDDNTYDRLAVKETIHKQRSQLLKRGLHNVYP